MLTDSLRSNGKRDFWFLQLLMLWVQERLYDAIKQAALHLKDFLSCALSPPGSDEQGLQPWESVSRSSGIPHWKGCLYAIRLSIPIVVIRQFLTEWGCPYLPNKQWDLIYLEPYRSSWNNSFLPMPLLITRWHFNGCLPPLVSFDGTGPLQPELWKALAAMAPVIIHRSLNEQRYIVWACVLSPYAFLLARNQSDLEIFKRETV